MEREGFEPSRRNLSTFYNLGNNSKGRSNHAVYHQI